MGGIIPMAGTGGLRPVGAKGQPPRPLEQSEAGSFPSFAAISPAAASSPGPRRRAQSSYGKGLGPVPVDLVLDTEFFAFEFGYSKVVGVRAVVFVVDFLIQGGVLRTQ